MYLGALWILSQCGNWLVSKEGSESSLKIKTTGMTKYFGLNQRMTSVRRHWDTNDYV